MDYSVGSVAALISGNVTPNRPRLIKRALTPTKHQPSPNVTPKSEFVDDRSIFLSPSVQKKKAIVKKSPKRIFQAPDLDVTSEGDGISVLTSPKADKVKKHLKNDLDANSKVNSSPKASKSPKKKHNNTEENNSAYNDESIDQNESFQASNENTPKKKKGRKSKEPQSQSDSLEGKENATVAKNDISVSKSPKKKKQKALNIEVEPSEQVTVVNKKRKLSESNIDGTNDNQETDNPVDKPVETQKKKKNKRNKKKKNTQIQNIEPEINKETEKSSEHETEGKPEKKKKKHLVNPNAITNKDTDSEHESDNEIESETEQANNEILDTGPLEESSDEEETPNVDKKDKNTPGKKEPKTNEGKEVNTEEEIKRTLFVGNVPFSKKCKKEIKKIFSQHGDIETVRIRTVPVKDARVTPKMAVIKNELHPSRTTVNVYVKYKHPSSVEKALCENNRVFSSHTLRVSRADCTGAAHDPRRALFVGNLPFALEDDTFREKFSGCGEIESVRIVRDGKTNAGKGFGYINFASKDGVELALAMSEEDLTIKNRILRVKRCTMTTNKKPSQPSKFKRQIDKPQEGRFNGPERKGQNGKFQGRGKFQKGPGKFQNGPGRFQKGQVQGRQFQGKGQKEDGAYRRIMNKRPNQNAGEGPANKMAKTVQPKEKKQKKEFVGMTAEKKKKRKFNKGDKKKKALSEILTK